MIKYACLLGLLVITLAVASTSGYKSNAFDKSIRMLRAFSEEREVENKQDLRGNKENQNEGMFECKKKGKGCRVYPKCCGDLVCYWADGFSLRKDGMCIDCISRDAKCQRDAQCCKGLQCDRQSLTAIDGRCNFRRSSGKCYWDSQCVGECKKAHWYEPSGVCTAT